MIYLEAWHLEADERALKDLHGRLERGDIEAAGSFWNGVARLSQWPGWISYEAVENTPEEVLNQVFPEDEVQFATLGWWAYVDNWEDALKGEPAHIDQWHPGHMTAWDLQNPSGPNPHPLKYVTEELHRWPWTKEEGYDTPTFGNFEGLNNIEQERAWEDQALMRVVGPHQSLIAELAWRHRTPRTPRRASRHLEADERRLSELLRGVVRGDEEAMVRAAREVSRMGALSDFVEELTERAPTHVVWEFVDHLTPNQIWRLDDKKLPRVRWVVYDPRSEQSHWPKSESPRNATLKDLLSYYVTGGSYYTGVVYRGDRDDQPVFWNSYIGDFDDLRVAEGPTYEMLRKWARWWGLADRKVPPHDPNIPEEEWEDR